jgi:hypothetical protein
MIETYFARTSTIARLRSGPLGPDLDALARACASKGMHGTASDGICAAAINSHGGCVSTGTPSPSSRPHSSTGSCKQPLRIIHSTPQPATRSPFHQHAREHCHGTNPLFLPTRSRGAGVHLPEALLALAQRRHFPSAADRATHTSPTQTLHRAHPGRWPAPATAVRPVGARSHPCPRAPAGAPRAAAPDAPPAAPRGDLAALLPPGGLALSGLGGRGHWRANGPPSGGPWRQCHGPSCDGSLLAPPGTLFHGQPAAVAFLGRVLACLAAALLCDLHLEPLPLDAFDPARRERKAGAISDEEAMQRLERSPDWGWTVRDPQSTRLVGGDGGRRTLALAPRVVPQVPAGLAPGWVSLFGPDGRKA